MQRVVRAFVARRNFKAALNADKQRVATNGYMGYLSNGSGLNAFAGRAKPPSFGTEGGAAEVVVAIARALPGGAKALVALGIVDHLLRHLRAFAPQRPDPSYGPPNNSRGGDLNLRGAGRAELVDNGGDLSLVVEARWLARRPHRSAVEPAYRHCLPLPEPSRENRCEKRLQLVRGHGAECT